jgi:2'-5' RNA ligase superfamily
MESDPIIITAQMGKEDQPWANGLRRAHFPPERNYLDAHITLFHHLPPGYLGEIKSRLAALAKEYPPPRAQVSGVLLLGRGVAYGVDSPELLGLRQELAGAFTGLLTPQDQAKPRLHITIQNKVEPREAKALHGVLSGIFRPHPLAISGLAAYYYRGGPWEAIRSWSFRG